MTHDAKPATHLQGLSAAPALKRGCHDSHLQALSGSPPTPGAREAAEEGGLRVNYYEHHIGDYAEATSHLSIVEDGAYSRLIRKYYSLERPLPADLVAIERLVGARTKEEKSAVSAVLQEFFVQRSDGWHNERCDEEIARYQQGEPERNVRRANETGRMRRHREERARLFEQLHTAGEFPAWNIGMGELRAMHKRHCGEPETTPETRTATAPATPATATQSPVSNPHFPDTRHQTPSSVQEREHTPQARSVWLECRAEYPKGLWEGPKEILAERAIGRLLEQGESAQVLLDAASAYRLQQEALGKCGTEFVRGPEKFYGDGYWRGPFPLPQSTSPKTASLSIDELKAKYPCPELDRVGS